MSPGEDLQRKIVRALRHGEFGFRGSFERGGYLSIDSLKAALIWGRRGCLVGGFPPRPAR